MARRRYRSRRQRRLNRRIRNIALYNAPMKNVYNSYSLSSFVNGVLNKIELWDIDFGVNMGQRIGHQVRAKGIKMLWEFNNNSTTITSMHCIRIIVAKVLQPSENAATNFFVSSASAQNNPTNFGAGADFTQSYLQLNRAKHKVMLDKKIKIMPRVNESNGRWFRSIRLYVPFHMRKITYAVDAVPNAERIRPYYVIYYYIENADNQAVGANTVTSSLRLRQYFRD